MLRTRHTLIVGSEGIEPLFYNVLAQGSYGPEHLDKEGEALDNLDEWDQVDDEAIAIESLTSCFLFSFQPI